MFFSIGFMLLSPIAYFAENAQQIIYFGALIPAAVVVMIPFIKESFRWQISNGNIEEGRKTIQYFVKKCGGSITDNELDEIIDGEEQSTERLSIRECFIVRYCTFVATFENVTTRPRGAQEPRGAPEQ